MAKRGSNIYKRKDGALKAESMSDTRLTAQKSISLYMAEPYLM